MRTAQQSCQAKPNLDLSTSPTLTGCPVLLQPIMAVLICGSILLSGEGSWSERWSADNLDLPPLWLLSPVLPLLPQRKRRPEDAKDYRTAVMTSLRGHVVAASMHVRGLVDDHGFLIKHAEGLASAAAELQYLFPAGSNVDDSEALPDIWHEPDEFSQAIEKAQDAVHRCASQIRQRFLASATSSITVRDVQVSAQKHQKLQVLLQALVA